MTLINTRVIITLSLTLLLCLACAKRVHIIQSKNALSLTDLKSKNIDVLEHLEKTPGNHDEYLIRSHKDHKLSALEHLGKVSESRHREHSKKRSDALENNSSHIGSSLKILLWESLSKADFTAFERRNNLFTIIRYNKNEPSLIVDINPSHTRQSNKKILKTINQLPKVRHVEDWRAPTLSDAFGNYIIQSNRRESCNVSSPYMGCTPLWDAGLDGTGQILGIGDSGLNSRVCMFDDQSCGPSSIPSSSFPQCGGSYSIPPCQSCIIYCSYDERDCEQETTSSSHRIIKSMRSTEGYDVTDYTYQHGTQVSSIAIGSQDPTSDEDQFLTQNQGVAPKAQLVFQDVAGTSGGLNIPIPFDSEYFSWFATNGAYVSSHSWGSESSLGYTSDSQAIDLFTWNNPSHVIIFAAGNEGSAGKTGVTLQLGPESSSKNALAVGATLTALDSMLLFRKFAESYDITPLDDNEWNPDYLAWFSSTGPTMDGRIKPDIVAPGTVTLVARENAPRSANNSSPNCDIDQSFGGASGTSFSAPLVAGYAILIRQYLVEGRYRGVFFHEPSAMLIKNILIHFALPLSGINYANRGTMSKSELDDDPKLEPFGSMYAWGFGRPLLYPLLENSGSNMVLVDTFSLQAMHSQELSTEMFFSLHEERSFCLALPDLISDSQLTISLVYNDYPASVPYTLSQARKAKLVNNLDLISVDESCLLSYPNGLSTLDSINNVEKIRIKDTTSYFHLITVRATKLQYTEQHFSLVVSFNSPNTIHLNDITLFLNTNTTNYDDEHQCSRIYSNCDKVYSSFRNTEPINSQNNITHSSLAKESIFVFRMKSLSLLLLLSILY